MIKNELFLWKFITIILLVFIMIIIFKSEKQIQTINISNFKGLTYINYETSKFAIIRRISCPTCGLFSFYIVHLGCINKYINMGYIPIIDVMSFPNVFNGFNLSANNIWEFFFDQPFGCTLKETKKKSKIN